MGRRNHYLGDYDFMADSSELLKRRYYRNYEGYVHFVTSSALISSLWIWLLFYGGPPS